VKRPLITAAVALAAAAPADARSTYATAYCLHGTMRDGTYTRAGSAASNWLRLGTRITLTGRSFYGRRHFTIRDTGSALGDGHLDLWTASCHTAIQWGKRSVTYRIGWLRPRVRWTVHRRGNRAWGAARVKWARV
jgi:3D (Asp-Asp-Asp) domain-containing protein